LDRGGGSTERKNRVEKRGVKGGEKEEKRGEKKKKEGESSRVKVREGK